MEEPSTHPHAAPAPAYDLGSPRPRRMRLLGWLPDTWVLTRGDPRRRAVHLTFDDGPHPRHTPVLLDLLARHGARATFFVIGDRAQRHPALVRRLLAEGHGLGNHSWAHPDFARLQLSRQREEIERTERLLAGFDGRARRSFRPPRGAMPAGMLVESLLRRRRIAYWSYDSLDYSRRPVQALVAVALAHPLRPGDIVLMHDDSAHSLGLLEAMLPRWKAEGFAFEPLPEQSGGDAKAAPATAGTPLEDA